MSEKIENPKGVAQQERKIRVILRSLAVIASDQTERMLKQARRILDGNGEPDDLKPMHEADLKKAVKHALIQSFRDGRKEGRRKLADAIKRAPASVRELAEDLPAQCIAAVRELDNDALRYAEFVAEYEKWADSVVESTLARTVDAAKQAVAEGLREGTPWHDYGWDKRLGKYTEEGMRSTLAKIFADYEEYQLRRVAITEHTRAVGLGNIYEYQQDKMVVGCRWVVEYTGCPICDPRDGQVFDLEFARSIHPAHPNCQCVLDPVFEWEFKRDEVTKEWDQ
jgi:hypothetical protein